MQQQAKPNTQICYCPEAQLSVVHAQTSGQKSSYEGKEEKPLKGRDTHLKCSHSRVSGRFS